MWMSPRGRNMKKLPRGYKIRKKYYDHVGDKHMVIICIT